MIDFSKINVIKNPSINEISDNYHDWLLTLSAPTVLDISGQDSTKTRVITTLIHGNEPSGFIALHQWLSEYLTNKMPPPKTNLRFIIASVEAAQHEPRFTHRYLPNALDLNRCFNQPNGTDYYQRADLIKRLICDVSPEVVVDLHNTSGFSPAFAVGCYSDKAILNIVSLFCSTLIVSNLSLGALMEQAFNCPTITIECGGRLDSQSHEVAYQGIKRLAEYTKLDQGHHLQQVDILTNPMRLKLKPNVELHYGLTPKNENGVTLKSYIEQFNVGITSQERIIGWLDNKGLENLTLNNAEGVNVIDNYFYNNQGQFTCKRNMRIFMATNVKQIAEQDCLFYVAKSNSTLSHP